MDKKNRDFLPHFKKNVLTTLHFILQAERQAHLLFAGTSSESAWICLFIYFAEVRLCAPIVIITCSICQWWGEFLSERTKPTGSWKKNSGAPYLHYAMHIHLDFITKKKSSVTVGKTVFLCCFIIMTIFFFSRIKLHVPQNVKGSAKSSCQENDGILTEKSLLLWLIETY